VGDDTPAAPDVRVEPAGISIGVTTGEPVMLAARRQGYHWPNICGGQALCGACMVRVVAGSENTAAPQAHERTRLKLLGRPDDGAARLACQLMVTGPVTVFKRGVKPEHLTADGGP
jgi:2Fe-2S ferredoxin